MRSLGGLLFCTMTLLPGPMAHAEEWWHGTFVGEGATSCENDGSIASYEAKKARYSQRECTIDKITTIRDMDGVLLDQTCPSKKAKKPVTTRELLLKLPDGRVARYPNLATLQGIPRTNPHSWTKASPKSSAKSHRMQLPIHSRYRRTT